MQKVLKIGDRDVTFAFESVTPVIYQQEFGTDYFADIAIFYQSIGADAKAFKESDLFSLPKEVLSSFDFSFFSKFSWACAKTADEDVPTFIQWLRENPDFDRMNHGKEILALSQEGSKTKKKSQKNTKVQNS